MGDDLHWRGIDADWFTDSNWSLTPGGPGDGHVPTFEDNVFFDASGNAAIMPTGDIECLDMTFEVTATAKFFIHAYNAAIHGDFTQHAGYFAPMGGGGHVIDFKENWLYDGGSFSVGTGVGIDPTCLFSGTGKTYANNNAAAAAFQNLNVTGTLTVSGTRLGQANVSQKISVTGTLTINKYGISKVCDIDLSGSNAGFDEFTGEIKGTGRMWYRYRSTSTMPSTGTISIKYWRYVMQDATATLPPRTYGSTCEVEVIYESNGQKFMLENGGRHYLMGKVAVHADDAGVSTELDCKTHDSEMWVGGDFSVKNNAFPSGTFTWSLGNGKHVFRRGIDLYYSYASAISHLAVDSGESTAILWPKGRQLVPIP